MLGTETQLADMAEMLGEEILITSRDDPHRVARIGGKRLQTREEALGGHRGTRLAYDGSECAVVVKHEQPFLGVAVLFQHRCAIKERGRHNVLPVCQDTS